MPLLDAALAFALTMLGLATVVTMVVGSLQRFFDLREDMLKELLADFFDREIEPTATAELNRMGTTLSAQLAARADGAIDRMAAEVQKAGGLVPTKERLVGQVQTQRLIELSGQEVVHCLRTSELGQQLQKELGEAADQVFAKLAQRWGQLNARASANFRRRAHVWSAGVAVALAFLLNFDALYVLGVFLDNEEARGAVVAQQQTLLANYQSSLASATQQADADQVATLTHQIQALRQQVQTLQSPGFPAGWGLFPNCPASSSDGRCVAYWLVTYQKTDLSEITFAQRSELNDLGSLLAANRAGLLQWLLGCLTTALLAGLGAPFWYDVVMGLGSAAQRLRNPLANPGNEPPGNAGPNPPAMPGAGNSSAGNPGAGNPGAGKSGDAGTVGNAEGAPANPPPAAPAASGGDPVTPAAPTP